MQWAKLHSSARFNLATSGLANYPLARLPVRLKDLEITGPNDYGYAPLQQRLSQKSGAPVECVAAAAGTSMANHLALASVLDPGDQVLIEQPTYELLTSAARYLGAEIRRFPRRAEQDFRVDPAEVERACTPATRLIVLTNLHNPSAVRTSDETLGAVGETAARRGARVLVDEVYLDACFDSPVRSAFHLGPNFLATNSLTKVYGLSGLRCGWILAPPDLAQRIWRLNDLFASTAAHPAELLSAVALDHLPEIAEHARTLISRNRKFLDRFLDSRRDLIAVRPGAGTIAFPRLAGADVETLCRVAKDRYETSVVPGRFFEMPEHFRIGIGGESAMVEEGLERLGRALDELG
jgi:aspartate/methionine/tyrosine aminotransferase